MKKKIEEIGVEDNSEIPYSKPELDVKPESGFGKPNRNSRPTRVAKFVRIVGSEVIIDVNGNGERIPYNPEKHSSLKSGEEFEI